MYGNTIGAPQRTKMFMDISTAAEMAGFSLRHFRRIIEEDQIPIVQIGRKFFITGKDFRLWETRRRDRSDEVAPRTSN